VVGSLAAPAVEPLRACLRDRDPTDDLQVVDALTAIGPAARIALPDVLATLERSPVSRDLRYAVARFLGRDKELVIAALRSEEPGARSVALGIVVDWSAKVWGAWIPEALDPVERMVLGMEKWDPRVYRLFRALTPLLTDEPRVTKFFLALARARCPEVREQASRLLARHRACLPLLIELLAGEDSEDRKFAFRALSHGLPLTDPEAVRSLWRLLRSDDGETRELTVRILVRFGPPRPPADVSEEDVAVYAREVALLLEDPEVRPQAAQRLGSLGSRALPWVDELLACLGDRSLTMAKTYAAYSLRSIAMSSPEARQVVIPKVLAVLRRDDPVAAAAAAHALLHEREFEDLLLERLPELIRSSAKNVHFTAVSAAEGMGARAVPLVPLLNEVAETPPEGSHVDTWAMNALTRIAPTEERHLRLALARLLDPERVGSRPLYQRALLRGGESAARLAAAALAKADAPRRLLLLGVLFHLGRSASCVYEEILPLTEDSDPRVATLARDVVNRLRR
jgi:HEAT repeat protein